MKLHFLTAAVLSMVNYSSQSLADGIDKKDAVIGSAATVAEKAEKEEKDKADKKDKAAKEKADKDRPICSKEVLGRILFVADEASTTGDGAFWSCRKVAGVPTWKPVKGSKKNTGDNVGPVGPTGPQGIQGIPGIRGPAATGSELTAPPAIGSVTPNTARFTTVTASKFVQSNQVNRLAGVIGTSNGLGIPGADFANATDGDETTVTSGGNTTAGGQFGCLEFDMGANYTGTFKALVGIVSWWGGAGNWGLASKVDGGVEYLWHSWQTVGTPAVINKTWWIHQMTARYIRFCERDIGSPIQIVIYEAKFIETP